MEETRLFDGDVFQGLSLEDATQPREQLCVCTRLPKAVLTNLVCGIKEKEKCHTHDIQVVLSQNTGPTVNRFP